MRKLAPFIGVLLGLGTLGCASTRAPGTPAESAAVVGYGYQPLDPFPVTVTPVTASKDEILASLPDETMRLATAEVTASGGLTYGPATIGYSGRTYFITIDYMKFTTQKLEISLAPEKGKLRATRVSAGTAGALLVPVYLGVGIRLTVTLTVHQGSVNLGSLFAVGIAAEAKKASGTLVIQTLGISGENISTAIPMPSELTAASIQNAIQALGTIKAKLYAAPATVKPRVLGFFNTREGGRETVETLITAILQSPMELHVK